MIIAAPPITEQDISRDAEHATQTLDLRLGQVSLSGEELRDAALAAHHLIDIRAVHALLRVGHGPVSGQPSTQRKQGTQRGMSVLPRFRGNVALRGGKGW